jgi:hypothetical protein
MLATYLPSAIAYRGQVCNLYARGLFTCHDSTTGKEIYARQRIDDHVALRFAGQRLQRSSEDGDMYVIRTASALWKIAKAGTP